jgi:hypothetical protein
VQDYALSATYLGEPFHEERRKHALAYGYTWEQYAPLLGCPPEYMLATLQYVRTIGLSAAEITTLRTTLVL